MVYIYIYIYRDLKIRGDSVISKEGIFTMGINNRNLYSGDTV